MDGLNDFFGCDVFEQVFGCFCFDCFEDFGVVVEGCQDEYSWCWVEVLQYCCCLYFVQVCFQLQVVEYYVGVQVFGECDGFFF